MYNAHMTPQATIHQLETCSSTNTVALDLVKKGAAHGTVVVTKEQTEGRGRQGRSWIATENSLAFSLILRPDMAIEYAPRLTLIAAVALLEALHHFQVEAYIKWPNDIVILAADKQELPLWGPFRKVAGILAEISSQGSQIQAAVVGIGINLDRENSSFLVDNLPHAGFLSDAGFFDKPEFLLATILKSLQKHFDQIHNPSHWADCLEKIRHFSATLNRNVRIEEGNSSVVGKAIAIRDDGSLWVQKPDGKTKAVYAGDVGISL